MVLQLTQNHEMLVTVEDNTISGGAGSGVQMLLSNHSLPNRLLSLGLPDEFIEHGDPSEQKAWVGLDSEGIAHSISRQLARTMGACVSAS